MKLFFLTLSLVLAASAVSAKSRITGQVVDASTKQGVAYATVSLLDGEGHIVTAWATDGRGEFNYSVNQSGTFTLSANAISYTAAEKEITLAEPEVDAGTIEITAGVEIEGVTVTGVRPLVEADIDKLSYNVASDPEAPVNTVLDMMRKVPLLSVDAEDNVMLQGQSNYKVLVDGKALPMMDNSFKEVIRSMPANSIKSIEVITNPSSKYEAEGIGGIINIVTDRRRIGGYNGSLNLGGDSFGSLQTGVYLNATTGKFSVSGYVGAARQRRPANTVERYQENFTSDEFHTENTREEMKQNLEALFYNVSASYEIDSLNLLTLALNGTHIDGRLPSGASSVYTNAAGVPVRELFTSIRNDVGIGFISGNLDYQRLFKKPDQVLTASYRIATQDQNQNGTTTVDGRLNFPSYAQKIRDDARSREHTLQLDYVDPLAKRHIIETGVKAILRRNASDPETRIQDGELWPVDPSRRNALDYNQYILGVYGAYTYKLDKFSAKAGVRLETTWNDGTFSNASADTRFDNTQFNPIPYVTLSWAPKPASRYTLGYTQRLSRPGIWYLNPYFNDNDPMNTRQGNPKLDAEIGHTFNATYGLFGAKSNLNLTANAAFVNNAIELIAAANDQGVTHSTYQNAGKSKRYSLNAYYSWRPSGKFSFSAGATGSYADLRGGTGLRNSGWQANGNLQTRVALWKGGAATANAYYSSPYIMLQGEGQSFYFYGLGLSQTAFKQKVTFNLSISQPFQKNLHYTTETDAAATFYRRSESWIPMRALRFNVSWNFGKTQVQVKRARRTIENNDVMNQSAVSVN